PRSAHIGSSLVLMVARVRQGRGWPARKAHASGGFAWICRSEARCRALPSAGANTPRRITRSAQTSAPTFYTDKYVIRRSGQAIFLYRPIFFSHRSKIGGLAAGPDGQRCLCHALQILATRTGAGLDGDALHHRYHVARHRLGLDQNGEIPFVDRPLHPLHHGAARRLRALLDVLLDRRILVPAADRRDHAEAATTLASGILD